MCALTCVFSSIASEGHQEVRRNPKMNGSDDRGEEEKEYIKKCAFTV